jgi:hypothetical protein
MPSTSCCRSCPRCNDCPVLVAAAARARRREQQAGAFTSVVDEVLTGTVGVARRPLPAHIEEMLEALDTARRGDAPVPAAA